MSVIDDIFEGAAKAGDNAADDAAASATDDTTSAFDDVTMRQGDDGAYRADDAYVRGEVGSLRHAYLTAVRPALATGWPLLAVLALGWLVQSGYLQL